jgi:protein TonB
VSWQQSLVARLAKVQRYPAQARGVQGVVSLAFTIDRQGKVVSSKIIKSSGSAVLDAEALDLIKRAAPLPPPPSDIPDSALESLHYYSDSVAADYLGQLYRSVVVAMVAIISTPPEAAN